MVAASDDKLFLENQWNFFLDNGSWAQNPEDYLSVMKKLGSVESVQEFWSYLNGMKQSMCKIMSQGNSDFSLRMFRSDTKPIWEDKRNTYGGRWVIQCNTIEDPLAIWSLWQEMLMSVVGESFGRQDAICGCVLYIRSNGRKEIHIWMDSVPADLESERKFISNLLSVDNMHFRAHDKDLAKVDTRNTRAFSSLVSCPEEVGNVSLKPTRTSVSLSAQTTPSLSPQTTPHLSSQGTSAFSPLTTPSLSPQTTSAMSIRVLTELVLC